MEGKSLQLQLALLRHQFVNFGEKLPNFLGQRFAELVQILIRGKYVEPRKEYAYLRWKC